MKISTTLRQLTENRAMLGPMLDLSRLSFGLPAICCGRSLQNAPISRAAEAAGRVLCRPIQGWTAHQYAGLDLRQDRMRKLMGRFWSEYVGYPDRAGSEIEYFQRRRLVGMKCDLHPFDRCIRFIGQDKRIVQDRSMHRDP